MLSQRVWSQWGPLAPSMFISFSNLLEKYSKQPAKWSVRCVGVGLPVLKQGGIPDSSDEYLNSKEVMEESAKVITMSVYLFLVAALCVDLRTGNTISKWAYGAVVPTVGFTAGISAHWMQQDGNAEEWVGDDSMPIYSSDIHTSNLKFISKISPFAAAVVSILLFLVPLNIVRVAVIVFLFIFLPYFFDLSTFLWATVAVFIVLVGVIGAMLAAVEIFGPCAGCAALLIFYGSYAVDMSLDLIMPVFISAKKFLSMVFEIY